MPGFHCLLYGPPGLGKTTLASQLPRPLWMFDTEGGTGWLRGSREGLTIVTPDATGRLDPLQQLTQMILEIGRTGSHRALVVDSLSALRDASLRQRAGVGNPSQADYGAFYHWLGSTLAFTQSLPQVLFWVMPLEEIQTAGRSILRPGGVSENNLLQLIQYLDAIVYLGVRQSPGGKSTRYLTVEPTEPFGGRSAVVTKDRTGLLPGTTELPGLDKEGQPPEMVSKFFGGVLSHLFPPTAKRTK